MFIYMAGYEGPQIESIGLPPERHADRVVAEMLRHLAVENAGVFDRILETLFTRAGNPKAQMRLMERIKRIGGKTIMGISLKPGTRGRYEALIACWAPYDQTRKQMILPGDPVPEKPWLLCDLMMGRGRIPGKGDTETQVRGVHALFITHHALSRLAQRIGARTIGDLTKATEAMFDAYTTVAFAGQGKPQFALPQGARLHFKLDQGEAKAIVMPHEDGTVVVTIVPPQDNGEVSRHVHLPT